MKRQILTFIVLVLSMCASSVNAQSKGKTIRPKPYINMKPDVMEQTGCNAKGQLPPAWVKNKVTPEQYDTLAMLNMMAIVGYNPLKGYITSSAEVRSYMAAAGKALRRFMADEEGVKLRIFEFYMGNVPIVSPIRWKATRQAIEAQYVLYSSKDGYDAHVLLTITLHRDNKTKNYVVDSYQLSGYSLGGAKVEAQLELSVASISIEKKGEGSVVGSNPMSADYLVSGLISFTDPLGCKHQEQVGQNLKLAFSSLNKK